MMLLPPLPEGERLDLPTYYQDFATNFDNTTQFWKLERGQHFTEPGNASWEAFNRGHWNTALALHEQERERLTTYHNTITARGAQTRRVRIIAEPPTPYLQWELHLLNLRHETGGPIRVLPSTHIRYLEHSCHGPTTLLPEIYTFDTFLMYQAVYDTNGALEAAIRYTDPQLITFWRDLIQHLYRHGEPVDTYFQREISWLPPAKPHHPLPDNYLDTHNRPTPLKS